MDAKQNISFIDKCKKNWKVILIAVLSVLFLNKCTQSCNRQSTINAQEIKIEKLDSTVSALCADTLAKAHTIDILVERLNTANANTDAANARREIADANTETAKANAAAAKADAAAVRAKAEAQTLKNEIKKLNDNSWN